MSHAATHWLATVRPDHMTHGEFRVLFHLCDCHNPSLGCFPKQTYLRERTGLSNGGLNKALGELEHKGLLQRKRERDERTNWQKPTRYILGFEMDKPQEPSPLSGDGAVSTFDAVPSPLSEGSDSTGVESYIDEPVKEPVKEPCADRAQGISSASEDRPCPDLRHGSESGSRPGGAKRDSRVSKRDMEETSFTLQNATEAFISAYPKRGTKAEVVAEFEAAVREGADPDHILGAARAYAREQAGNDPKFIARPENWLRKGRWKEIEVAAPVDHDAILARRASWIIERRSYAATSITSAEGRELVEGGFVSPEQCRAAGVIL